MKKLRMIRDRAESILHPQDLRGLNDPPLFAKSGFHSRLTISGVPSGDQHLQRVIARYGLAHVSHEMEDELTLRVDREQPGEHKIHAIHLFFAALEIHRSHPSASLLLHQHDGLRSLISSRLDAGATRSGHDAETTTLKAWRNTSAPLSLDEATSLYLAQAGVLPRTLGELQAISHEELARIHDLLTGSHATEHSTHLGRTA
jgi:hypothetical protein